MNLPARNTRKSLRHTSNVLLLLVASVLSVLSGACSSPRIAPAEKIEGVDIPASRPEEPVAGNGVSVEEFLAPFVDAIAAAAGESGAPIAVFPPLTRDLASRTTRVSGLGELFMEEIAAGLRRRGVKTLSGAALINDLYASNLRLGQYREPSDLWALASGVGAPFVVGGTVKQKDFERVKKDSAIDVDLEFWQLAKADAPAELRAELRKEFSSGYLAQQLARYDALRSDWQSTADREN